MGRQSNIQKNNFDVLRLAGALGVVFSHSFAACLLQDPIALFFGHSTLGDISVQMFFLMSGFLVTRSAEIHPILSYAQSRFLRLVPGLFVVSLFCVFVIGPIFTSLPLTVYFTHPITIRHLFNADIFYLTSDLPGVTFQSFFSPNTVNGSLWTIPYEATMYIFVGLLVALKLIRSRVVIGLAFVFALIFLACDLLTTLTIFEPGPALIFDTVYFYPLIRNGTYFLIGGAAYMLRDKITYSHWGAAIAISGIILSAYITHGQILMVPSLMYLTFYAAFGIGHGVKLSKTWLGDISYGIYLYGLPLQHILVRMLPGITPWQLMPSTIALLIPMAWLSWRYVERPALRYRAPHHPASTQVGSPSDPAARTLPAGG